MSFVYIFVSLNGKIWMFQLGSNNIVEIYKNAGFKKLNTNTLPEAVPMFLDIYNKDLL